LPLFEDLGSGWLGVVDAGSIPALSDEPTVLGSVGAAADLVAFSGDKLLGGPQAGIVVGRRDAIERARKHPLMRALRADKLTYAALDATLALWQQAPARVQIPVYRMLTTTREEIEGRAKALVASLKTPANVTTELVDGFSTVGGGSAPGSQLPTVLVAVRGEDVPALEEKLRRGAPHVIGRIEQDSIRLDLRTVDPADDKRLAVALRRAVSREP
jgi:L-seryl-tRNA(Ser) seleniumtransferase